jgi:hypothetical protein
MWAFIYGILFGRLGGFFYGAVFFILGIVVRTKKIYIGAYHPVRQIFSILQTVSGFNPSLAEAENGKKNSLAENHRAGRLRS